MPIFSTRTALRPIAICCSWFYLKNGYADVQIVAATAEFDPSRRGFHVVFTIDEGEQYRVGAIDVVSNIRSLDAGLLRSRCASAKARSTMPKRSKNPLRI